MKKTSFLVMLVLVVCFVGAVRSASAGTLAEMQAAVNNYAASGAISDAGVKATLSDLIAKAQAASDADAQAAYRGSFIDLVNAFAGSAITSDAAAALVNLAQQ